MHTTPQPPPLSPHALPPGTELGSWRVVEQLGVGGYGAVYRVESRSRPGRFFALKLALDAGDARAERERALMMHAAEHPHVVRYHGSLCWPDSRGVPGIVMDWVPGPALDVWAEREGTSLRALVRVGATVARTLGELHGRGVLHRDLKPEHILVREPDGQPVLLDFGVGWYVGALPLTSGALPPGTAHLRSPESVRFLWKHFESGAHYAFQPTDDLYALGVCLYRAATGHYPFTGGGLVDLLQHDIVHRAPLAPADLNPRIPRALSDVLLRLLAKEPGARHPSGAALAEALEGTLATGTPEAWDASVFDWVQVTTEKDGQAPHRRLRRPQRPTLPLTPPRAPPPPEPARDPRPPEPPRRPRRWLVLGMGVLLCLFWREGTREPWRTSGVVLPAMSSGSVPTSRHGDGQEVAPGVTRPEIGPVAASTETRVQEEPPVKKTQKTPRAQTSPAKKAPAARAACWGLVGAALQACAHASPPPAKTRPPPEECPAGAVKEMEERFGLELGDRIGIDLPHTGTIKWVPVYEGPLVVNTDETVGRFKEGIAIHGRFIFAGDRVYGRFTRAQLDSGELVPICLEIWTAREPGAPLENGTTRSYRNLYVVERFE